MNVIWGAADLTGSPSWLDQIQRDTRLSTADFGILSTSPHANGDEDSGSNKESGVNQITGFVRLHNSLALARQLGVSRLGPACHDLDIALAAYHKWGVACVGHLDGQFCFAVLDQAQRSLFVCVDPVASIPTCYWSAGSRFCFSSSLRSLLGFPDVPRKLNRGRLASLFSPRSFQSWHSETFHEGICSIAPGSWVVFDKSGVRSHTYWSPQPDASLVPRDECAAIEVVRELLFDSVRSRIRPGDNVTTQLSGGLDSSTITAITAHILGDRGQSLVAVAGVLPEGYTGPVKDEREFIREFRTVPNVQIDYVTAPGAGPFDRIHDPKWFDTSFLYSSRFYIDYALEDAALSHGSDLLLDGTGGESGPSTDARGYYLELAAGLKWGTFSRVLKNPPTAPPVSLSPAGVLRKMAGEARELFLPDRRWRPLPLLADEFLKERRPVARHGMKWPNHQQSQLAAFRSLQYRHAHRAGLAAVNRIRHLSPLFDKRLIEFCISAPGWMKLRGSYPRYLIRAAMEGILPPRLQWRTTKAPFSPDYYFRYNAQLPVARDFVAAIGPKDPVRTIVDVERLQCLLEPVDPVKGSMDALVHVPCSIYLICFLRQFADLR